MHLYRPNIKRPIMYPWGKRTLFVGRLSHPIQVIYGAATLIVSLDDELEINSGQGTTRCISLIVPAGQPLKMDTGSNTVAICHLDVMGNDYHRLAGGFRSYNGNIGIGFENELDFRCCFADIYRQPPDSDSTYERLDRLLRFATDYNGIARDFDLRAAHVVEQVKLRFQENLPIERLAAEAGLSVSRLMQVFKKQTGVPIRRFRLWHRLYQSLLAIGEGQNLTEAAMTAGFFDSSHYLHAFSDAWGVGPRQIFGKAMCTDLIPPQRYATTQPYHG